MENIKSFNEKFDIIENKQDPTEFNTIIQNINKCIDNDTDNFIELCYWFAKLKEHFSRPYANPHMYYGGYENKSGRYYYERIIKDYGLDEKTVNRMVNVALRFVVVLDSKTIVLDRLVYGFNRSKLFELLPMSNEQIKFAIDNKRISCDSTCKTIREYIKSLKGTTKSDNKVLEEPQSIDEQLNEVEDVYNPKRHYDFEYFEKKTKTQLLNIVWDLQKEYEKIKGGGKK